MRAPSWPPFRGRSWIPLTYARLSLLGGAAGGIKVTMEFPGCRARIEAGGGLGCAGRPGALEEELSQPAARDWGARKACGLAGLGVVVMGVEGAVPAFEVARGLRLSQ